MKTLMRIYTYKHFLSLALFILFAGFNGIYAIELQKKIVKGFNVKQDTKIIVDNKFGTVHINTWSQNRVDVEIEIVAKGNSEKKTKSILNNISVDIDDRISAGYLKFQTQIESSKGNVSFEINYVVNMPAKNDLKLTNSFGNVYLQNLVGDTEITVKYGQLLAEDISGKSKILLTFGSGRTRIGALDDADVTVKYSKVDIESANKLKLDDQFSDARLGKLGSLELKCKYGEIEIDEVEHINGNGAFSGLLIGQLNGSIILSGKYGDGITIDKVSRNFTNIDISNEFSGVDLTFEKGVRAQLDLHLSFGSFRTVNGQFTFTRVIKKQNTSDYGGYIASENATAKVKISTKYGNIKLNIQE